MITNTRDPEDFEDIENHESSKDDIYNEAASFKKFDDMQKEIDEIIKQRDSKMNEFKTISSDVADISSKKKSGEATEEDLKKQSRLRAKLNVLVKEIKEISNHINELTKTIAFCVTESHTERNVSNMNEQIVNILEAFKTGVLSTEEATTKLNVIQESSVEESRQENTSKNSQDETFMTKQNHIMESYKLGVITASEAMQLIERITMEFDMNEAIDDTVSDTVESLPDADKVANSNTQALADYINSLDEATKSELMSSINVGNGTDDIPLPDDAEDNTTDSEEPETHDVENNETETTEDANETPSTEPMDGASTEDESDETNEPESETVEESDTETQVADDSSDNAPDASLQEYATMDIDEIEV